MDITLNKKEADYQRQAKLYIEDLDDYGENLMTLIQMYRRHIFVSDLDTEKILQELEYYATQIINRNYDALIMHADELIMHDPSEPKELPKELPF